MAVSFEVEVFGEKLVSRTFLRFGDQVGDLRPALRDIAGALRAGARKQFATQGKWGSGGWAPLNPAYRARKLRAKLDPKILHATHRLRDSLVQQGSDHIELMTKDELRFGSRVPYGKYHAKTRPPMQLPEVARREVMRRLQVHIIEQARA